MCSHRQSRFLHPPPPRGPQGATGSGEYDSYVIFPQSRHCSVGTTCHSGSGGKGLELFTFGCHHTPRLGGGGRREVAQTWRRNPVTQQFDSSLNNVQVQSARVSRQVHGRSNKLTTKCFCIRGQHIFRPNFHQDIMIRRGVFFFPFVFLFKCPAKSMPVWIELPLSSTLT